MQFTRPTRNTHIRVFGEGGDEVVTINVRTSAAVIYPSDALGRTLIFDVNICQLPISHTFYILLDEGKLCVYLYCVNNNIIIMHACMCVCVFQSLRISVHVCVVQILFISKK